ncbi:hypothetical protein HDV05_000096 [Chytridiales sp. JEL 0842]|nr:hypothetical protein HDV05_000096 [Chytridiales sp. JEL 0842]
MSQDFQEIPDNPKALDLDDLDRISLDIHRPTFYKEEHEDTFTKTDLVPHTSYAVPPFSQNPFDHQDAFNENLNISTASIDPVSISIPSVIANAAEADSGLDVRLDTTGSRRNSKVVSPSRLASNPTASAGGGGGGGGGYKELSLDEDEEDIVTSQQSLSSSITLQIASVSKNLGTLWDSITTPVSTSAPKLSLSGDARRRTESVDIVPTTSPMGSYELQRTSMAYETLEGPPPISRQPGSSQMSTSVSPDEELIDNLQQTNIEGVRDVVWTDGVPNDFDMFRRIMQNFNAGNICSAENGTCMIQ